MFLRHLLRTRLVQRLRHWLRYRPEQRYMGGARRKTLASG